MDGQSNVERAVPCIRCGYDLRGLTEPHQIRCPECGTPSAHPLSELARDKARRRARAAVALGMGGGVAVCLLIGNPIAVAVGAPVLADTLAVAGIAALSLCLLQFLLTTRCAPGWSYKFLLFVASGIAASFFALLSVYFVVLIFSHVRFPNRGGPGPTILELAVTVAAAVLGSIAATWPFAVLAARTRKSLQPGWLLRDEDFGTIQ